MDDDRVLELAAACRTLAMHNFKTVTEALLFFSIAEVALQGKRINIGDAARVARLPMSTASRCILELSQRGLVDYYRDPEDHRRRFLRPHPKLLGKPATTKKRQTNR